MTLDTTISKAVFEGNSQATVFPFAFKVWNTGQITVTLTDAAGASTDVTGQCAVSLGQNGGSVTYPLAGPPLPAGARLAVTRNMPFTQGVDLVSAARFDPQVMEDALDKATAERQQILEQMARAVILPPTSAESPQDVVRGVHAARDAATSAAAASSSSAASAAGSAGQAAGSAALATAEANRAKTEADRATYIANVGASIVTSPAPHAIPKAYSSGTIDRNWIPPALTNKPGIGRIATAADMEQVATVGPLADGPAFLAAGCAGIGAGAAPYIVPRARTNGKLDREWLYPATDALEGVVKLTSTPSATDAGKAITPKGAHDTTIAAMVTQHKGNRTTSGQWTITGCMPGKMLFILLDQPTNGYGFAQLSTLSGASGGACPTNVPAVFFLGHNPGAFAASNDFVCRANAATVVLNVSHITAGAALSAWQ